MEKSIICFLFFYMLSTNMIMKTIAAPPDQFCPDVVGNTFVNSHL